MNVYGAWILSISGTPDEALEVIVVPAPEAWDRRVAVEVSITDNRVGIVDDQGRICSDHPRTPDEHMCVALACSVALAVHGAVGRVMNPEPRPATRRRETAA